MKISPYQLSQDKLANAAGFISACVITLAVALWLVYKNPFKMVELPKQESSLKISLSTFVPPQPIEQPKIETRPPKPMLPKPIKKIKHQAKKERPIKNEPLKQAIAKAQEPIQESMPNLSPAKPAQDQALQPKQMNISSSAQDERFIKIVLAIKKHQKYPKQALKMRKTGIVEVSFILHKDGNIKNLKLIKSSGVAVLDEAALKSVQKASKEFPALDDEYTISLPISFKIL